jgi:hypothetical protein
MRKPWNKPIFIGFAFRGLSAETTVRSVQNLEGENAKTVEQASIYRVARVCAVATFGIGFDSHQVLQARIISANTPAAVTSAPAPAPFITRGCSE